MSSETVLKVRDISKRYEIYQAPHYRLLQTLLCGRKKFYKDFWALKGISFEMKRGECVGVIGRNGSGKSTLLQIVAGTLAPTHGSVEVSGKVSALLELGSGFNPEFTGRENVYMNGTILGFSKAAIDKRFDEIAAFADIGEFIDQPVKIYSSGMYIRLAFATAIHVDPQVLIVDEALAVGDFAFQQKCYQKITELKRSGCSILLVSHNLSSVIEFCDYAILLDHGAAVASGLPKDVVNKFKQLLSAGLWEPVSAAEAELVTRAPWDGRLQDRFEKNKNCNEYGGGIASIVDWGILDSRGDPSAVVGSEETVEVVMVVRFNAACRDPIVGYFLTDVQGREVVGTNTKYEGHDPGPKEQGDVIAVRFRQRLSVAPGSYSLNIGCSEHVGDEIVAHHRLYNVSLVTVHSQKRFVGFCSLFSEIKVENMEPAFK